MTAVNGAAYTVKLSKPITTHSGNTTELKFQRMTAKIVMRHKILPITVKQYPDGARTQEVNFQLLMAYVADLTGHDEEVLGQLAMPDLMECALMIVSMANEVRVSPGN